MGVVDNFAEQIGWTLSRTNVIVEGTSDVKLFQRASELHMIEYGIPIIDDDFRVCAAGRGDDGGVEGVNRMLVTLHQLARADLLPNGRQRYRFVGLLDNDPAGRQGIDRLTSFTNRLREFRDIFLLFPKMPICDSRGMVHVQEKLRKLKEGIADSRFEIEDLMSSNFLKRFEQSAPWAILKREPVGLHFHYHYSKPGKVELLKIALEEGLVGDYSGFFSTAKALRSYLGVDHSHIGHVP